MTATGSQYGGFWLFHGRYLMAATLLNTQAKHVLA